MKNLGSCTINLVEEERAYWISLFKKLKPKSELDKRIVERTLVRLMGGNTHNIPLYPNKECPVCEKSFHYKSFNRHLGACESKSKEIKFRVDPEILKRLEME